MENMTTLEQMLICGGLFATMIALQLWPRREERPRQKTLQVLADNEQRDQRN